MTRLPSWKGAAPWLLVLILTVILVGLFQRSTGADVAEQARVEALVHEIVALDARLNQDLLKLRHRQLQDYDAVAAADERISALLQRLQAELQRHGSEAMTPVLALWQEKREGLERFKQQNALLRNSQDHFLNLSSQLLRASDSPDGRGSVPHSALLATVGREIMEFLIRGEADDMPAVAADLSALQDQVVGWPLEVRRQVLLMTAHGQQVLRHRLDVESLLNELTGSPFAGSLEASYRDYSEIYRQDLKQAESYRLLLALFALFLIATVVYIMVELKKSALELGHSHAFLDNIANTLAEGILALDRGGRITFANQRAEALLGAAPGGLLGRDAATVLWPGAAPAEVSGLARALATGAVFEGEDDFVRSDGSAFPVAVLGAPLRGGEGDADQAGYVASFRDVSEIKQAEARLHLAARVFDSLGEAMVVTDARGRIQSVNPAFSEVTGYSEADARGRAPGHILASGQHDPAFYAQMWQSLQEQGKWQGEVINRRKSGETYPEWLSITAIKDGAGQVSQYVGLFTDITDRKQAEAHIHHLAYHDPLTGLPNRRLFYDRLENALRQAHRSRRKLAVLLLDLDRFKAVNDTLGHDQGDLLLKEVGARLSLCLREGDTLARLGGDEFVLLLPEVLSAEDASIVAGKLLAQFDQPVRLGEREIFASTSIGIALYPADGEDGESLLKHADVAMYAAKDGGRAAYRFFIASHNERSLERLELENDLRRAVEGEQLLLYYQPQIGASSGRIAGVEALVRWRHPTRGLVMPDSFIALAENAGLIDAIGHWCLVAACRQLRAWQEQGVPVPRVAVNVSARQLRRWDFAQEVLQVVTQSGIDPAGLELELTESSLADDPEQILAIFSTLRQAGVRVSIDDFGTGYSSLSYLSRYPVDEVKIDRSFVSRLLDDREARSVVRAVILLAHGLGMRTVAEGVETEAQWQVLSDLDCDELQGYLFSKPVPPHQIPLLKGDWQRSESRLPV